MKEIVGTEKYFMTKFFGCKMCGKKSVTWNPEYHSWQCSECGTFDAPRTRRTRELC